MYTRPPSPKLPRASLSTPNNTKQTGNPPWLFLYDADQLLMPIYMNLQAKQ